MLEFQNFSRQRKNLINICCFKQKMLSFQDPVPCTFPQEVLVCSLGSWPWYLAGVGRLVGIPPTALNCVPIASVLTMTLGSDRVGGSAGLGPILFLIIS